MCGCSTLECHREVIGRMFVEQKLDVLALSETKLKGKDEWEFRCESGRMSGVTRGRARKGVTLMVSLTMIQCVVEWKEVSSRLMCVKVKLWVLLSTYRAGSERDETERKTFGNDLDDCLQCFGANVSIVLLGDLNTCADDEVVEDVVGRDSVFWKNENGERMIELCIERELVTRPWKSSRKSNDGLCGCDEERNRMVVRCESFERGRRGMSDNFLVEGKLKVGMKWGMQRES